MDNIEKKVQEFFTGLPTRSSSVEQKNNIKNLVLSEYNRNKENTSWITKIATLWQQKNFRLASTGVSFVFFLGIFSLFSQNSIAGVIEPKFGDITLIQDGKTHIIRERTQVRVGDVIHVADGGKAQLTLSEKIVSTLRPETEVRVIDKRNIYVAQGSSINEILKGGKISTVRGTIHPEDGASFEVNVSETGETKVSLREKSAEVIDWLDGKIVLNAGEQINLRADSKKLAEKSIPDLKLSFSQTEAIQSKLIISRTKFFSAIEKRPTSPSFKNIESAEKTFRSIIQILKSDRQLNIIKRTNSDLIANKDVFEALNGRTEDTKILQSVKATEKLFSVYKSAQYGELSVPTKDSRFFNRFSLIDQIFKNEKSQEFSEILKDSYVQLLAQKIINTENRDDQLKTVIMEVQKIPRNGPGKEFKKILDILISPYLPGVIGRL